MLPKAPPELPKDQAVKLLNFMGWNERSTPVAILGYRGYFKNSMGVPKVNDIGIYDDAIFLVSPTVYLPVNANVDPSKDGKTIAHLKPGGAYLYKIGLHNMKHPYTALRQFGRVTVLRDGVEYTDTAEAPFYIDIHKGGYTTTSSLGCQTIHPSQWDKFLRQVKSELLRYDQTIIPYYLYA